MIMSNCSLNGDEEPIKHQNAHFNDRTWLQKSVSFCGWCNSREKHSTKGSISGLDKTSVSFLSSFFFFFFFFISVWSPPHTSPPKIQSVKPKRWPPSNPKLQHFWSHLLQRCNPHLCSLKRFLVQSIYEITKLLWNNSNPIFLHKRSCFCNHAIGKNAF